MQEFYSLEVKAHKFPFNDFKSKEEKFILSGSFVLINHDHNYKFERLRNLAKHLFMYANTSPENYIKNFYKNFYIYKIFIKDGFHYYNGKISNKEYKLLVKYYKQHEVLS